MSNPHAGARAPARRKTTARLDPKLNRARMDFCAKLPLVAEEAHRLGLVETGHALHEAVRRVGYETADIIERIGWPK